MRNGFFCVCKIKKMVEGIGVGTGGGGGGGGAVGALAPTSCR